MKGSLIKGPRTEMWAGLREPIRNGRGLDHQQSEAITTLRSTGSKGG